MKRKTVILISLIAVLLLAGLCACKQEVTPEEPKPQPLNSDSVPGWEKSNDGLQNLPAINVSGTETGITEALINGLKNPPTFKNAKNLIVIVCEGLTSELIEAESGESVLKNLPVKGTTTSKFTSEGKILADYVINDLFKTKTGIAAWGELSTNSMRRMTTTDDNEASKAKVSYDQFEPINGISISMTVGKGDFSEVDSSADQLNEIYKSSAVIVNTLEDAIALYKKDDYYFYFDEARQHYGAVKKLYTIFENEEALPSFRKEAAFSLAWMQSIMDDDGFALFMSYSPASALDAAGLKDFEEGVAVAAKYVLENPDTVLLICGCPIDGSEATVPFYGLGKGVSAQSTLYECVSSLF